MTSIEVVGLGALNIDHIYKVDRILDDGEAVVNRMVSSPGGSAANTVYGLAKLGVTTGFVGVVGDDAEGKILLQDFQKVGVDISRIGIGRGARTGSVLCLSDKLGRRSLYVTPGANNRLSIDDPDLTYINQATMVHISSFAGDKQLQVLLKLIDRLHSSIKVSFAPGTLFAAKGLKALIPILARTHLLLINRDEIQRLTGESFIAGAKTCLQHGCNIVVVTLGKGTTLELRQGTKVKAVCYITDAENEYAVEPRDVAREVDTTGAGDAFATGFIFGLLHDRQPNECGQLGNVLARLSIARLGTRQGFPTFNQLAQRYRELYSEQL